MYNRYEGVGILCYRKKKYIDAEWRDCGNRKENRRRGGDREKLSDG